MHPLYADIFDVTLLKRNAHFRTSEPDCDHSAESELITLTLNEQLWADIQNATEKKLTQIYQASEIAIQADTLFLPSQHLTTQQKRQLWELLCG
jgi:hypothetical protein